MSYHPLFDPPPMEPQLGDDPGDHREGRIYVYNSHIILAINVALATNRPLLVRGPSGGGKSTLARNVARGLKWRYYEQVITSRMQAQDLLWDVDHLQRLQDAQLKKLRPGLSSYIRPGILWWAFDRNSALSQVERTLQEIVDAHSLQNLLREADPNLGEKDALRAVILLDEIDKADPDLPNNLLVPLGSLQFTVSELGAVKTTRSLAPLVVITTNDERALPTAFLRRCVELILKEPGRTDLITIGESHYPKVARELLEELADHILGAAELKPSIAEYLDTVRACDELDIRPGSSEWDSLTKVTVWKHGRTAKPV